MRPGGERIKSPLYMLALRHMNWSAEHRQEADHMAPLTGIHAYFINNKPIYSAFLADVEAQGGSTDPFSPASAFPDGKKAWSTRPMSAFAGACSNALARFRRRSGPNR